MRTLLKTIEYRGEKYEIMMIRENGTWFLQDFKNGEPFSPYRYSVDDRVDVSKLETTLGQPLLYHLISNVEKGVHFWVENKDKIKI
jgi:hypothetical protein